MHSWKSESQTLANIPVFRRWILAARIRTLGAAVIPVLVGSALAYQANSINIIAISCCLLAALCLQISTNYINDASDYLKGADTEERKGPPRMAQLGLLKPKQLFFVSGVLLLIAFLFGLYLATIGGFPVLILGIVSILAAIAYTAGPFPLAYYGLGDLFVLLFFGIAAVCGTYYVQTLQLNYAVFLFSILVGLQATSLIIVNNTRDIDTDIKSQKNTVSVRLGEKNSKIYFSICSLLPYLGLFLPILFDAQSLLLLLPWLSFPLCYQNIRRVFAAKQAKDYNGQLAATAKLQLLFGVLLTAAIVIS